MHVVILSHNYPMKYDTSFGFFCKQQAEALAIQKVRVGVVIPLLYSVKFLLRRIGGVRLGYDGFSEAGVETLLFYFPSPPRLKRLKYWLIKIIGRRVFKRYVNRNGVPDLVHLHNFLAAEVACWIAETYNIKVVYTEHFSELREDRLLDDFERDLIYLAIRTASVRIAVSQSFADHVSRRFACRFMVVPNTYDSRIFCPTKGIHQGPFRFINVGHVSELKNQVGLLRAFRQSFAGTDVRLAFVGSGARSSWFMTLVSDMGLAKQVDLVEALPPLQVWSELTRSNVLVVASHFETFGVVLIEAMACGLPLLATRCGGPESIIVNDELGILVDKDTDSITKGLVEIHEKYQTYDRARIAHHAKVNYSYEAIGSKLVEIYKECL